MSGSSRFAVAVHILCVLGFLERRGVELVQSGQIAKSVNTNAVVIRNILRALKKAGLVLSKEGKGGGVRLARKPARISLHDVYDAVESGGMLCPNKNAAYAPCPVSSGMKDAFLEIAGEVDGAVAKVLRSKTLDGVMRGLARKA
ncbi:MAG: Rrf2 family transcriptional regulator [Deltaproteobacteria bacterium]|nr:Rrf2 family transcriptional regulator [Deltaproteobacteria bacterium]